MPQWTMQTGTYVQNTSGRALQELQELAVIAEHSDPLAKPHLELGLCTKSNQVVLPLVQAALFGMKSMIREIREQQQFIATLEVLSPLENLKVLATSLPPGRPREPDIFQKAICLAPNLEILQLYMQTHNATVSALRFLTVLAELPKVTSLRLVTNGNAACLLPSYLMHITCLELGRQVYFRQVPPKLRELCLEGLDLDYLGYDVMMSVLAQAITPVSLTLSSFALAAMLFLPGNLQKLSVQYLLHVHFSDIVRSHALHTGLARLASLRVLCIADFLSENLVYFLSGTVFPELHTLGFYLDSQPNTAYYSLDRASGRSILRPASSVDRLVTVFPNLQRLKVSCVGLDARFVRFDCAWIKWTFVQLRSISCYSTYVRVQFMNLAEHIYVTYKV